MGGGIMRETTSMRGVSNSGANNKGMPHRKLTNN